MNNNKFLESLKDDLRGNGLEMFTDGTEIFIDSLLDEGVLKDIPIAGTLMNIGKLGLSFKDLYFTKKYITFITDLRNDNITVDKLNAHMNKLDNNPKKMNQELELLLAYIDSQKDPRKLDYMANIYRAYLNQSIYGIDWKTTVTFFDILDRLLPQDIDDLKKAYEHGTSKELFTDHSSLLRVSALGLMQYFNGKEEYIGYHKKGVAKFTNQGKLFVRIIMNGKAI